MATPHPSFADVPAPSPVNRAWIAAADKERFWYSLAAFLLAVLFAAILFWPRTTPNIVLEASLCAAVAFAGSRHGKASRARARLTPLPPAGAAEAPPAKKPTRPVTPLEKAPRA